MSSARLHILLDHTASYAYDSLNRLTSAVATGSSTYNLTFIYNQDGGARYGNMSCQTNQQTQGLCANVSFNAATNQISTAGYTYDAAGNMTSDGTGVGSHTYQWDGDGRLKSATVNGGSTVSYVYNALGQQVDSVAAGPAYRETYYDAFGRTAVSQNHTTTLEDFFPPVAGRNYVKFEAGGTLFLHTEVRGTSGILTTQANGVWQDQVYYPLGQQWVPMNGGYDVRFGSLRERDPATGFDPTAAREYNSNIGRWMSPDPLAGDISNPQSLNRYAYALNNPTTLTDPLGLDSLGMSAINCRPGTAGCKVLPSCHGMVCADQYYGGSMYPGFTSADQTTCTIDSVSANCNSAIADLQNGSATLTNISVSNPGAIAGSAGSILVQLPGTCSSVSFLNTSTSGTCSAGSDELVSLPGAGPSLGLISGGLSSQANSGSPDTLDNRANALAQALRKTGVRTLNNPCTIGLFYGASAGGAAAATVDSTATVATLETWGVPATGGLSWLYGQNSARVAVWVGKGLQRVGNAVQNACNYLGTVNW